MNSRLAYYTTLPIALLFQTLSTAAAGEYLHCDDAVPATSLRVSNNHPFIVRDTFRFTLPAELAMDAGHLLAFSHSVAGGAVEAHYLPVQLSPDSEGEAVPAWIDVQLRANESRVYTFQALGAAPGSPPEGPLVKTFPSGLPHFVEWPNAIVQLPDLALIEIVENIRDFPGERFERLSEELEQPLRFQYELIEENHGPVKSSMLYRAFGGGVNDYDINVRYNLFPYGVVDIHISLQTTGLHNGHGYLALLKKLATGDENAAIGTTGDIVALNAGNVPPMPLTTSPLRGREADWLATGDFEEGYIHAILAQFAPAGIGAIGDAEGFALNQLVLNHPGGWAMIAEVTNTTGTSAFVLPEPGEAIELSYRVLGRRARTLEDVNNAFTAYTGYQARTAESEEFHMSFGTGLVRFGASYSPHPVFQDGITPDALHEFSDNLRLLEETIRRDFRIANAIGLELMKIDNVRSPDCAKPYLTIAEGRPMLEYLEIVAGIAKETGMGLVLTIGLHPEDARLLAERFGNVISIYEIDPRLAKEELSGDWIDCFNAVQNQIRTADAAAKVAIAGGTQPLGIQKQLRDRGLRPDAIGQIISRGPEDSADVLKTAALSHGGYATRHGVMPLNSGHVINVDSRDTEMAQAMRFFKFSDAYLSQRGVPVFVQVPWIEHSYNGQLIPAAMLRPDRSPKTNAHAYHELIRRYGGTGHRSRELVVTVPFIFVNPGDETGVDVRVTNLGNDPVEIVARLHLPEGLTAENNEAALTLGPKQTGTINRAIRAAEDLTPGMYHFFEEIAYNERIRFGWSYAYYRAAPQIDLTTEAPGDVLYADGLESFEGVDLSNIRDLVFGRNAPDSEIVSSWEIHNALRHATGTHIQRLPHDAIDKDPETRGLMLVGNQVSNPLIAEFAELLPADPMELSEGEGLVMVIPHPSNETQPIVVVSGRDTEGVTKAAADFMRRIGREGQE